MTIYSTDLINIEDVATQELEKIPEIPVYYPSMEEFKDFKRFIQEIENRGAHHMGLCKIVPPKEWVARSKGYSDLDLFIIPNPICQTVYGKNGIYLQSNEPVKSVNFQTFRQFSYNSNYITPKFNSIYELEKVYWDRFHYSRPLYGANISGTLTDPEQKAWNIANLPSILSDCLNEPVGGVNTPYLYFGGWMSTFGWHVEDMELYSINYLHFGLPKFWYVIPPAFAIRFEKLVKRLFNDEYQQCPAFLRHKSVIISPSVLKKYGIPTRKIIQEENEFMITFPYGYHSGFNTGLNIAESTNFGSSRWLEYGRQAVLCKCWQNTVKLDMGIFSQHNSNKQEKIENNTKPQNIHPLELYEQVLRNPKDIKQAKPTPSNLKASDIDDDDDETDWMGEMDVSEVGKGPTNDNELNFLSEACDNYRVSTEDISD